MADNPSLTEIFRQLGARNPEGWARSQENEGIPQLARFLFLKRAWESVVSRDDMDWIDSELQHEPNVPGGAISPALQRILESGVKKQDLTTVVRTMQWQLLFHLCYLLDGPNFSEKVVSDVDWQLFQVNDEGEPTVAVEGLHESVLEMDPSGTEMIG